MKKFFNHFFVALAGIASLLTMLSCFFDISWEKSLLGLSYGIWLTILIILCCSVYSILIIKRTGKIKIKLSENFQLTVKKGDIFDQKNFIVIPVDERFNTHVGDGVVTQKSIHGQFINKYFKDRTKELDEKINESIIKQKISGVDVPCTNQYVKSKKYELGTCVDIPDGGNRYIFVVTTEYDENNVKRLNRKDLSKVIEGLFNYLEPISINWEVNMPIIGAGNARLNLSPERILFYLIDYFDFSMSERKLLGGVNIIVKKEVLKEINLNRIESIFKKK